MTTEFDLLVGKVRDELDSHCLHIHCNADLTSVHETIDALSDWYYREVIPKLQRLELLQSLTPEQAIEMRLSWNWAGTEFDPDFFEHLTASVRDAATIKKAKA